MSYDLKGVSTLGKKKGPYHSFLPSLSPPPPPLSLYLRSSLSSSSCEPSLVLRSHTDIQIASEIPTADTNRAVPSRPLLSAGGRADVFLTSTVSFFFNSVVFFL